MTDLGTAKKNIATRSLHSHMVRPRFRADMIRAKRGLGSWLSRRRSRWSSSKN